MGKPVNSDVKRVETKALNTKVNKEVFDAFKDYCKELGYPMNVMLETFMRQYANGRFEMDADDIVKWKDDGSETDTLSTTFNKEIYTDFKFACKENGYFVKHVIMAFLKKFTSRKFILEYINAEEIKNVKE